MPKNKIHPYAFDVAFLAWQRDKSKRKILNVYQIGRFLFLSKKILSRSKIMKMIQRQYAGKSIFAQLTII